MTALRPFCMRGEGGGGASGRCIESGYSVSCRRVGSRRGVLFTRLSSYSWQSRRHALPNAFVSSLLPFSLPPLPLPPPPHGSIPRTLSNGQQPEPRLVLALHQGCRNGPLARGRQCPPRRWHLCKDAGHGRRRRRRRTGRRQAARGCRAKKEGVRPP